MKRLTLLVLGLALVGGMTVGCSKTADIPTATGGANGNVDKITADATKCADMAGTYATMFTPLATGGTDADRAKIESSLNDMKAKVPTNIQKDLDTINGGIKEAKTPTAVMTFLSSKDYTTANDEVTKYLTTECSKVGS